MFIKSQSTLTRPTCISAPVEVVAAQIGMHLSPFTGALPRGFIRSGGIREGRAGQQVSGTASCTI
ncbi:hypothetical protein Sm713_11100 [Streptomyces sp. TS71-3]|nr:hypothetical protein Sm713_11100 [Streptomyces sp. TS71-3]